MGDRQPASSGSGVDGGGIGPSCCCLLALLPATAGLRWRTPRLLLLAVALGPAEAGSIREQETKEREIKELRRKQ